MHLLWFTVVWADSPSFRPASKRSHGCPLLWPANVFRSRNIRQPKEKDLPGIPFFSKNRQGCKRPDRVAPLKKKAETAPSAYAPEPDGGPSRGSSCMNPRTFFKTPPSKPPDTRGRRAGRRFAPRKDGRDV